jgi:hypothetical protein
MKFERPYFVDHGIHRRGRVYTAQPQDEAHTAPVPQQPGSRRRFSRAPTWLRASLDRREHLHVRHHRSG